MQDIFKLLRQRAALEHPTFPANPWIFRVPEVCSAAMLDCRSIHGILWVFQETFLKASLLEKDHAHLSSKTHGIFRRLLADRHQEISWNMEGEARRDPQSSSIPTARPNQGIGILNFLCHIGGFYSQNGVMDSATYPISELHLGKLFDSLEFQSWKVNFKTEVRTNSVFFQITMHWIKEVEFSNSIDDLMTSQSITGRREFLDYEMFDAKIVFALKKLLTSVHFRRRGSVEEKRAREDDRFLRGRQSSYMIYEYFRATWGCEIVQGLSDLFTIRLQNNDVQDFDSRSDQALLAVREILTEMVLEVWNKSKLQDLVQFQTVLALYEQEDIRNNVPPNYYSLKTLVRRHIDQTMRTRNFRARSEVLDRGAVTKSQKGRHASVERKEGECHQWKGIGHCSKRRFVWFQSSLFSPLKHYWVFASRWRRALWMLCQRLNKIGHSG